MLPCSRVHAALLLWLLRDAGVGKRALQGAIVCALVFILCFIGMPPWHLARR